MRGSGVVREESMVSSSRDLFPLQRINYENSSRGREGGPPTTQDSLSKFKHKELPYLASSLIDSHITRLSIGGEISPECKDCDQICDTDLTFKTRSMSANTRSLVQISTGLASHSCGCKGRGSGKGLKRKRASGTRYGTEFDGEEECEREEGIVLGLATLMETERAVKISAKGAENCSSVSDEYSHDLRCRVPMDRLGSAVREHGDLLRLGQTGESSECAGHHSRRMYPVDDEGDVHLGLGPTETSTDTMKCVESTSDGIPVVDEGSSSARYMKSGGFMPALLIANSLYIPDGEGIELQYPEMLSAEEDLVERDLCMSIRASNSGTTSTSGGSDRGNKVCKFRGCGKGARGASGLCIAHGGGRRCQKNGCSKGAEGRTVYCKAHGGGRRCQNLGCTKSAEGKTDYCIGHGGGRRCSHDGCDKAARGRSGLCIRHGGGKRCLVNSCTKSAEGYSGLCISHGGGRRCQYAGCSKGAQGRTMFCKAHGGGKRCMIAGCSKGAEGSTPLCKGHGGGKRCMHDGGGICTKSVHGGTLFCVAHGGGKRCQVEGCSKSARGRTDFCVRHGGGKRCKIDGCGKSAQGSTDFCKAHGGGKRCQWGAEGSGFREAGNEACDKFARGKTGLCAAHSAQVQDHRVHGGVGQGLTPGLFRVLVPGSGQTRLKMGDSQKVKSMETGPSEQLCLLPLSEGQGTTFRSSSVASASFSQPHSATVRSSASTACLDLHKNGGVLQSFQQALTPEASAPSSIQKKEVNVPAKLKHGRPPLPPHASSDDGVFSGGPIALPEGRVHRGGLMAMLSRDARNASKQGSVESILLEIGPSKCLDARLDHSSGLAEPFPVEMVAKKLDHVESLGADVGQFLAARMDLG